MKLIRNLIFVGIVFLFSCSGGDDDSPPPVPDPPSAANLVFPLSNSECTTGVDVSISISEVTFEWQASANTDLYTLNVINLNTSVPQTLATTNLSATLAITKGAPFSWSVTSTNADSQVSAVSENWLFYNAGAVTNYPPFPATLIAPESGATVPKNGSDEVVFTWSGADVENDLESYAMLFGDDPNNLSMVYEGTDVTHSIAGLTSGNIYYWEIVSTDAQGNTSDSGLFDFKVD